MQVGYFLSSEQHGGALKVCFDEDERAARELAHRLWANDVLPGELAQILPTPAHFEQASELVTEKMVAEQIPCGSDIDAHLEALARFEQAGFDEVYVQQVGPDLDGFFSSYQETVLRHYPTGSRRRATATSA
jgi:hypothetical protein